MYPPGILFWEDKMTIGEVISRVKVMKPNAVPRATVVGWLDEMDAQIYRELVLTHAMGEEVYFTGYDPDGGSGEDDVVLMAKHPYDRLYLWYVMAQIDLMNQEYDLYQNDAALYNNAYSEYAKYYNRCVLPLPGPRVEEKKRREKADDVLSTA